MTRKLVRRITGIILVVGLVVTGCASQDEASTPQEDSVVSTFFANVVTASGKVVPAQWAGLSFETGGRVEWLVEEGEQVSAGEVLARLDAADLDHAVAQAQAALDAAQAQLALAKAGARAEEIAMAEGTVASAQAALEAALVGQATAEGQLLAAEAALDVAEAQVAAAQADLDRAKAQLAQVQAGATEADIAFARSAVEGAQAQLEQLLSEPDEQSVEIARLNWDLARNALWQAQLERDATKGRAGTPGYQKDLADAVVGAAEVSALIAQLQHKLADKGATDEQIRVAQAAVRQAQAQLDKVKAGARPEEVDIAQAGVDAAEAQLAQAGAGVDVAKADLVTAQAGVGVAQAGVDAAQAQLDQAQASLDLLNVGARSEEIALLEANAAQAEAALAQAESAQAKAVLVAPFAGTVGAVYLREGEMVTPGTPVVVVGDVGTLRVETTDLNEVDAARVAVDSSVTLTFDALPGGTTDGQVLRIAPMASVSQGGTNFTAVIEMTSPPEALRWGMTAFVDIEVE
jgi:HlyD family secretion protein